MLAERLDFLDGLLSGAFGRFEKQPYLAPRFMAELDGVGSAKESKAQRK